MNSLRKLIFISLISLGLISIVNTNCFAANPMAAAGRFHNFVLHQDGTLWAWGGNSSGQLGDGTEIGKVDPFKISIENDWSTVYAGNAYSLAIKNNGTLWAWGSNIYGQLGDGTNAQKNSPVAVGASADWATIAAGGLHTVGLMNTAGTLWTWGANTFGQLGDGTTNNTNVPGQIGTDTDWAAITAGGLHTLAVKTNGTLWAWGHNVYGQLGDGTNASSSVPLQVGVDTDWAKVAAGMYFTVALKTNGTLWAWGYNSRGQLGDGTNTDKNAPVQIGSATDWTDIAAGNSHTVALKSDGTLWTWGYNEYGQLDDGTFTDRNVPMQSGVSTQWTEISAGDYHTLVFKDDGTLWASGRNNFGQLGDGTFNDNPTSQEVFNFLDTDGDGLPDNVDPCPLTMPMRVEGGSDYWQSLQTVYDFSLQQGDKVLIQSTFSNGPLVLDRAIDVTFKGGFDCDFLDNSGAFTPVESIVIDNTSGIVTIENISFE